MHNQNIKFVLLIVLIALLILLFVLQITLFVQFVRKRKNKYWISLIITSLLSCISAIGLMFFMIVYPDTGWRLD